MPFSHINHEKSDVISLHASFKNKLITGADYSCQLRVALYQHIIPDNTQIQIQEAGIDVLKPAQNFTPCCDKETLIKITEELSKTDQALKLLNDALQAIPNRPGVLYPPNKYRGIDIISHYDWHTFYNKVNSDKFPSSLSKEELYTSLIYPLCISIILTTHTISLTYASLLMCGANII